MKRYSPVVFVLLAMALLAVACGGTGANTAPPATLPPTEKPVPSPAVVSSATPLPPPTATVAKVPSPTATEAVVIKEPTVAPTDTVAPPSPTPAPDWLSVQGRTADGLPTLGNPDAPVVVIDYSDFL